MPSQYDAIRDFARQLNKDGNSAWNNNEFEKSKEYYLKAVSQLENIPIYKLTPDDWRKLAQYRHHAGKVSDNEDEATTLYLTAISNLKKNILKVHLANNEDYRNLAKYYVSLAEECSESEKKLSHYKRAIHYLRNVKNRTSDDWRQLATYKNYAGKATSNPDLKFLYYQRAIKNQKHIRKDDWSDEDSRDLAIYHYNASIYSKPEEQLSFCQAAIDSLKEIKKFHDEDWRELKLYYVEAAEIFSDHQQKFAYYQEAITSLKNIPDEKSGNDWRMIANYFNEKGLESNHLKQKKSFYECALQSQKNLQRTQFTNVDWFHLGMYQHNIGATTDTSVAKQSCCFQTIDELVVRQSCYSQAIGYFNNISQEYFAATKEARESLKICQCELVEAYYDLAIVYFNNDEWVQAQTNFYRVIEVCNQIKPSEASDFEVIRSAYGHLLRFTEEGELDHRIYSFAIKVFSNKPFPEFKEQLLKLHLRVFNFSTSKTFSTHLLTQLLQLIENTVDSSDFPNANIAKYLSKSDQRQLFKDLLQQIAKVTPATSLLQTVENSSSFSVALVTQLMQFQEVIRKQQETIQSLKEKIEKFEAVEKETPSVYSNSFVHFKNPPQHPSSSPESLDGSFKRDILNYSSP